jgi:hypothetical protein
MIFLIFSKFSQEIHVIEHVSINTNLGWTLNFDYCKSILVIKICFSTYFYMLNNIKNVHFVIFCLTFVLKIIYIELKPVSIISGLQQKIGTFSYLALPIIYLLEPASSACFFCVIQFGIVIFSSSTSQVCDSLNASIKRLSI